ncbi:penicillin-binding protein 2 [Alginatibacterium sediminis]|uniref:Peptidoglycan D,D-transpeptidase MrdA n=2 Tax=Alginatibacterium sediminis TaxID=2164068 RepID=A0A420E5M0_9ALTE|nr:penicillin-binding protein 2 [Alginatibacterium sediminis]
MRDHSSESNLFKRRAFVCFVGVIALLCLLLANMYYLQLQNFETYNTRSNDNRISIVPIAPPRGLIYDRNGVLLAENRPTFSIEIIPERVDDIDVMLKELGSLITLSETDISSFNTRHKQSRRFKPITLKDRLSEREVAIFSVNQHRFKGAQIESNLSRYYPYGEAITHALGYVARINTKDVERLTKDEKITNYAATKTIGKQGIERYYEDLLHGEAGYQEVEVNNRGRIIRTLRVKPPVPGHDLYLNIDINLQLQAHSILEGRRGSIVLIDPETSGILALVSSPSYDPNQFVSGISNTNYSALLNSRDRPLINRASQGTYPPASTIKPLMAVMGLELDKIDEEEQIFDPGFFQIPNTKRRFRDWKRWGHGWVDVTKAIEQSVDTFFYKLAYDVGIDNIHNYMNKFGFGRYTGIDIHEETKANMPSREWKRERHRQPWWQGDTISVGIGQGYWTATPLQLAQATNILVNKGRVIDPKIVHAIDDGNQTVALPLLEHDSIEVRDQRHWEIALNGMYGVVNRSNGTARRAFVGTPYVSAGKSGTAQVIAIADDAEYDADAIDERHRDNAMFIAFAPYDKPKIVASIVVENAGGGSSNGGPIARELFDSFMSRQDFNDVLNRYDLVDENE